MKTLEVTLSNGSNHRVQVSEVEDCEGTVVYEARNDLWCAYFEADCNADVTELGELAVAALYSELVINVTEV